MFGTIAFFIELRLSLEKVGMAVAFPVGMALAVIIEAVGLRLLRRPEAAGGAAAAQ